VLWRFEALRKKDPTEVGTLGQNIGDRSEGLATDCARAPLGTRALRIVGMARPLPLARQRTWGWSVRVRPQVAGQAIT
jgi:hypothetical protein